MTQPLPAPRILTQATALAPLQQLAPLQPLNPLAQQVGFHIAFVADFLTTGAVLFAREFATPGAVLNDIHNGVPVPAAVGRALQTFAQIELEAGRELVGFAAEYVSFQLNFFANLVRLPFAAVGTLLSGLTPASATQAAVASSGSEAVLQTRRSPPHEPTAAATSDEATTTGQSGVETNQRVRDPRTSTSSLADTVTDQAKKFRSSVAKSESVIGTTAKTHDEDTDAVASNQAGVDAAATTTHGRSGVTHKRVADAGSTISSTTGGAGRADAGNKHEPHHEHDGHPKGGGDEGD